MDTEEFCADDDQWHRLARWVVAESGKPAECESTVHHSKLPVDRARPPASSELESNCEKPRKCHREDSAEHRFRCGPGVRSAAKNRPEASRIFIVERRGQFGWFRIFFQQVRSLR